MAEVITTKSSVIAGTNKNSTITPTTWTDDGTKISAVTLDEIQSAISKLTTYATKVSNCNTIYSYTVLSTSCQSTGTKTLTTTKTNTTVKNGYATTTKYAIQTNTVNGYVNCGYYNCNYINNTVCQTNCYQCSVIYNLAGYRTLTRYIQCYYCNDSL